jgi:hypothetical protein
MASLTAATTALADGFEASLDPSKVPSCFMSAMIGASLGTSSVYSFTVGSAVAEPAFSRCAACAQGSNLRRPETRLLLTVE